jgi:hypothetical protein
MHRNQRLRQRRRTRREQAADRSLTELSDPPDHLGGEHVGDGADSVRPSFKRLPDRLAVRRRLAVLGDHLLDGYVGDVVATSIGRSPMCAPTGGDGRWALAYALGSRIAV